MALRARKVSGASETLWRHCGWRHCVVFLCDSLYYQSAALHPDVQMGSSEFNAGDNPSCSRN